MRKGILKRATDLQTEFANKTGYKIGNFDIKKNRVVINPQTIKLTELKHPYNETLQTAMKNFGQGLINFQEQNIKLEAIGLQMSPVSGSC